MEKSILATNIDGLLLKHEVFTEPHKEWFERAIKKTKDNSLKKWIGHPEYFKGVNEAMEKIMPKASLEKRTFQARKWYQEDVIKYIKMHPEVVKKENYKKLKKLKEKYKLILVTTNTKDYINKIINASKLKNLYDSIIASKTQEEPDKSKLIKELIKKYRKPKYYLTGKSEEKITDKFKEIGTKVLTILEISKLE